MTFTSFAEVQNPVKGNPREYLTAFKCGGCHGGLFAQVQFLSGHSPQNYSGNIDQADGLFITAEYPSAQTVSAPKYLPENIANFFVQAAKSLKAQNYDASAMMSRKVLEVAVKKLSPVASGTLFARIEHLHKSGQITDDLKQWAHIIRDDGNEAAHEESPVSAPFADELLSFAELFLMYTFTMPGMVKAKMGESN